jgi:sigma-B regulation protein RsbU (phosphoserine phosphatase)
MILFAGGMKSISRNSLGLSLAVMSSQMATRVDPALVRQLIDASRVNETAPAQATPAQPTPTGPTATHTGPAAALSDSSAAQIRDSLRALFLAARAKTIRDFPPNAEAAPDIAARRIVLLRPPQRGEALTRPIVLVSTDGKGEGQPYLLADSPWPDRMWDAMGFDLEDQSDAEGAHLSGYAPVRDENGVPIALLAIRADSSYLDIGNDSIARVSLIIFAAAMFVAFVVASLLAWRTARPIGILEAAISRVASGEKSVRIDTPRRGDEFDALFARFNGMTEGLEERRRLAVDMEVASQVQQRLQPTDLPEVPGYQVSHAVRYCERTGGDYVDCFPLADSPDAGVAVILGDFTGHGIGAAMLASWMRALVRSLAEQCGHDPSAMFHAINRHLLRDAREGTFVTLFYGVLDPGTHTLRWASAGQEPAFLFRHGKGCIERLCAPSPPLGVLEPSELGEDGFAAASVLLDARDTLVIYSDGLSQTRNTDGDFLGFEAIERVLRSPACTTAQAVRDQLLADADSHRAGPQDDDVSIVVVRRHA